MKTLGVEKEPRQVETRNLLVPCLKNCGRYLIVDQSAGDKPGRWVEEQEVEYLVLSGDSLPWDQKFAVAETEDYLCPDCFDQTFGSILAKSPVMRRRLQGSK